MSVLVTGSNGFLGKNLIVRLNELGIQVITYTRENSIQDIEGYIKDSDCIVHLAGENRPKDEKDFQASNTELTSSICDALRSSGKNIPIILASSTQADLNNPYGRSKLDAESAVKALGLDTGNPVYVYRLPGVFGKWCKPNYNSVVATFCHNISQNLPIKVDNPDFELSLVYIDDVIEEFVEVIQGRKDVESIAMVQPEYKVKLGDLAEKINFFKKSRDLLLVEKVGKGFVRKLYSTYLSYLSPSQFSYSIPSYEDERGNFVEILKTKNSGQFSYFTAHPGVTRGGHYHHTKTEKFLVIHGTARFKFKNIVTHEQHEIIISGDDPKVVDSVPGWAHDITNIGDIKLVVMLWANEVFNHEKPDTYSINLN